MAKIKDQFAKWVDRYNSRREKIHQNMRRVYHKVNNRLGGVLGIIRHAFTNLGRARGVEASAALAYYGLFSIFPMMIAFVSIGSVFLDVNVVRASLLEAVEGLFPFPKTIAFVDTQITAALQVRGALTAIAAISLIWSSSNALEKVVLNINRAFPEAPDSGFLRNRSLALSFVLIILLLFLASVGLPPLFKLLPAFHFEIRGTPFTQTRLWSWISLIIPFLLKLAMFYIIYSWLPNSKTVLRKARFFGAVVAAGLWELVTELLTYALARGFANYELVYGSLASIIVLLFWLYWSAYILFLGAHVTNAIDYHLHHKDDPKPDLVSESAEAS